MFRLACGLYDQLEVFAMRKNKIEIFYLDDNGNELSDNGVITDIIAKDGVEKVILNSEKIINTQDILSVNGLDFKE